MHARRTSIRPRWQLATGIATGLLVGAGLLSAGVVTTDVEAHPSRGTGVTGLRDVLHSPPLFVERGEAIPLRYEAVCQADELGTPCPVRGALFVRGLGERTFRRATLLAGKDSSLSAVVAPGALTGGGLDYYARIEDGLDGSTTVPAGGALAPQRAWVVDGVTRVELGAHAFGRTAAPGRAVARAVWGARTGAAGLLAGKELVRIGPSAFDVAPDGSVVLLDQVNDRLSIYSAGSAVPRHVGIPFAGGEGDLAVSGDGGIHVLDHGTEPVVRSFSSTGALLATVAVDDHGADMLRAGPAGPVLHAYPGDMWQPLRQGGLPLQPAEQSQRARPGLSVAGGGEIVVRGGLRAATFAIVDGDRVLRAWRVSSATDLGEVQLVEPLGDGLLVVLRVWTESRAEFVALVLSERGLTRELSMDAVEWAESAALSRFRLRGSVLFQLRSAPSGVEIVTYDLGGEA